MMKPNLFMVGAPKCGTTAMALYLAGNEHIFFSQPKEPDYFARHMWIRPAERDVPGYRNSLDLYLALFHEADPARHIVAAEGSVIYFSSRRSLEEIHAFNPEARILVMLRNPVDLVYSFHAQLLLHLHEDEEDFEAAWRLQEDRSKGRSIPKAAEKIEPLLYGQIGRIGSQLQTLLSIFPRPQVMWLFFDDFVRDTPGTYRSVLEFLGVPDDRRDDFPVVNPNEVVRHSYLMRLMKENEALRAMSARLKSLAGVRSWGLYERLHRQSRRAVKRDPLSDAFRQELSAYFAEDVALLERITGRDLSAWRSSAPRAPRPSVTPVTP